MGLRESLSFFPEIASTRFSSTMKQKHILNSATLPSNRPSNRPTWSQVAARNIVSCHASHQQLPKIPGPEEMDEDSPPRTTSKFANFRDDLFHDVLTPYIIGLEPNSVLIDISNIDNTQALKQFLGGLNKKNSDHPFYGTLLVERRYLKRRFIETCWDQESLEYEQLLSTGLEMDNGTVIKGYPSLFPVFNT
jgi:hypothetical protein